MEEAILKREHVCYVTMAGLELVTCSTFDIRESSTVRREDVPR
jgi:hypothetical protein